MIAYCGLDCSICDAYIATQENDVMKREATDKKMVTNVPGRY